MVAADDISINLRTHSSIISQESNTESVIIAMPTPTTAINDNEEVLNQGTEKLD